MPVGQRAMLAYLGVAHRVTLPPEAGDLRRAADALVRRGLAVLEGEPATNRVYRVVRPAVPQPAGEDDAAADG